MRKKVQSTKILARKSIFFYLYISKKQKEKEIMPAIDESPKKYPNRT
jgi:hypothetical protein